MKARDHPKGERLASYRCPRDPDLQEGDRSAISTPRDTLGKSSHANDNARNVKDSSEGRAVDGNALSRKGAACSRLKGVAKSAKTVTKTNADKGESRLVTPPALDRVSYEDIYNIDQGW